MAMAPPEHEARREFGRAWRRRLLWLTLLAAAGWFALTAYYFRQDLSINLRLLWDNRATAAQEYAPVLGALMAPPPAAVPIEAVLRAKVPRPVTVQISVADVLVGNAVRRLRDVVPLVALPALTLLVVGYVLSGIGGRLLGMVSPSEFHRLWPAIIIPAVVAFGFGAMFGAAVLYYSAPIRSLIGI
ncbi:MAG: hypothetical protein RIM84_12255 [Alphaproteobacteria bacterium]